jgi:hypothetical protein
MDGPIHEPPLSFGAQWLEHELCLIVVNFIIKELKERGYELRRGMRYASMKETA